MTSKSKAKGNDFESDVAWWLTKWANDPEKKFFRTPRSGGLRWKGRMWTFGDITPPEEFYAVLECKWHEENGALSEVLQKPTDTAYLTWWLTKQLTEDCKRAQAEYGRSFTPMLCTKRNNRWPLLTLWEEDWAKIECVLVRELRFLTFNLPDVQRRVVSTPLERFLDAVPYRHFTSRVLQS